MPEPTAFPEHKLRSLLDLGRLIGFDLTIEEMLLQIAVKAAEVMDADRASIFLHDQTTDELYTAVALGMEMKVLRIPSASGIAGYCFAKGECVMTADAHTDPRFDLSTDARTGYRTTTLLCVPLHDRSGKPLGVTELLNKKHGAFTSDDETFLRIFNNHAAIFVELAQLNRARIEALERSARELERLNRAKTKALDHLSHEIKTPVSVLNGGISILKGRLTCRSDAGVASIMGLLEKNVKRLFQMQLECAKIIRGFEDIGMGGQPKRARQPTLASVDLCTFVGGLVRKAKRQALHRSIRFDVRGDRGLRVGLHKDVVNDVLTALIRNAVENTPNGGRIDVLCEGREDEACVVVRDFGVGISEEGRDSIFDGLFHTIRTDDYKSGRPYDFAAGGKGLDLLRAKTYSHRYGFGLTLESQRCLHLDGDEAVCPGDVSECRHCATPDECIESGGSAFTLTFSGRSVPPGRRRMIAAGTCRKTVKRGDGDV